jgi:hypothetical protein
MRRKSADLHVSNIDVHLDESQFYHIKAVVDYVRRFEQIAKYHKVGLCYCTRNATMWLLLPVCDSSCAQYRPKKGPVPTDAAGKSLRAKGNWLFMAQCMRHDSMQRREDSVPRLRRLAELLKVRAQYVALYKVKMAGQELFVPPVELPPFSIVALRADGDVPPPASPPATATMSSPRASTGGAAETKGDADDGDGSDNRGLGGGGGGGGGGGAAAADGTATLRMTARRQSVRWGFGAAARSSEILEEVPAEALGPRFVYVRASHGKVKDLAKTLAGIEGELPFEYIVQFRLAAEAELVCVCEHIGHNSACHCAH